MSQQEICHSTGRMGWMAYRKWKECKQQPSTAGPGNMLGCCLIYFHFLWAIHPIRPVYVIEPRSTVLSTWANLRQLNPTSWQQCQKNFLPPEDREQRALLLLHQGNGRKRVELSTPVRRPPQIFRSVGTSRFESVEVRTLF